MKFAMHVEKCHLHGMDENTELRGEITDVKGKSQRSSITSKHSSLNPCQVLSNQERPEVAKQLLIFPSGSALDSIHRQIPLNLRIFWIALSKSECGGRRVENFV
jgi:hypothetical protein